MGAYLGNVLDEGDDELHVGHDVEEFEQSHHLGEGDDAAQHDVADPDDCQKEFGEDGHRLVTALCQTIERVRGRGPVEADDGCLPRRARTG